MSNDVALGLAMHRFPTLRTTIVSSAALGLALLLPGCQSQGHSAAVPQGALESSAPAAAPAIASDTAAHSNAASGNAALQYSTQELAQATVHIVTVPPSYAITVAIAPDDELETASAIARQYGAVAALNAGFFDPQNGQTTSYLTVGGEVVADPRDNARLMDNPDLAPYREQILNRSEFRRYRCSDGQRYGITPHDAPAPAGCTIIDAVGGGPQLLPELTSVREGFVAELDGDRVRDALGETQPNARSAVGITAAGEVMLVAVAQRLGQSGSGLSLLALADLMRSLGSETALNLDGGSSTSLYYQGETYPGRWSEGEPVVRPVKSILMVLPPPSSR